MRNVATILCLLLTSTTTFAVQPYTPVHPEPELEPWRWRVYHELDGLGLECMTEDSEGNLWFGTSVGVHRYDGTNWTPFPFEDGLHGKVVTRLCATQDGAVYAGTNTGIHRYRDGSWSRVFPEDAETHVQVNSLRVARDGSVWAGTLIGAVHLGARFTRVYTSEDFAAGVKKIAPDASLTIVPSSVTPARDYGIGSGTVFSASRPTRSVVLAVAPSGPAAKAGVRVGDRVVHSVGMSSTLDLTVLRSSDSLAVSISRIDSISGTFMDFNLRDVFPARDGTIWMGLRRGGIVALRGSSGGTSATTWSLYTSVHGLDVTFFPRIGQSPDGTIWAAGFRAVSRFDPSASPPDVAISEQAEKAAWKSTPHDEIFPSSSFREKHSILATSDGTIWIGGRTELFIHRSGRWSTVRRPEAPIPSVRIVDLVQTRDGAIWIIGQGQEAVRLDVTDRWTTYQGLIHGAEGTNGDQWFVHRGDKWQEHCKGVPAES